MSQDWCWLLAPASPFPVRGPWEFLPPAPGYSTIQQLCSSEQTRGSLSVPCMVLLMVEKQVKLKMKWQIKSNRRTFFSV